MRQVCVSVPRVIFRAKAVHRLAKKKRWPAYVFAAVAQETPHDISWMPGHHQDDPVALVAVKAAHIALIYLSFTLID
jgi:hypothetical protein